MDLSHLMHPNTVFFPLLLGCVFTGLVSLLFKKHSLEIVVILTVSWLLCGLWYISNQLAVMIQLLSNH